MKNTFFISKVIISDSQGNSSEVSFSPGCNIIYGPSNTGKTLIINCIDYALGARYFQSTNNNTIDISVVSIEITTHDNKIYSISRSTQNNNNYVHISCLNNTNFPSQKIKCDKLTKLLLTFLGFENRPYNIINSKDYKTQTLSFRTLIGTSIINEEKIIRADSIFHYAHHNSVTATLSAIYVFITGQEQIEIGQKDLKLQKARKEAIENYIDNLKKKIVDSDYIKTDIDSINSSIKKLDKQISQQNNLLKKLNDKLLSIQNEYNSLYEEEQTLITRLERYQELEQDYISDLNRADFIIDAEKALPNTAQLAVCPICSSVLKEHHYKKYSESAKLDKETLSENLNNLRIVISQLKADINKISTQKKNYSSELSKIKREYKYESNSLSSMLDTLKNLTERKALFDAVIRINAELQSGINEEYKDLPKEYDVKKYLSEIFFDKYEKYLENALSNCNYDNYQSTTFDRSKLDIIANGESKSSQGKGYRAYLNSIVAFSFMQFMNENANHKIPFLILDSPLMSLKEAKENSSDSMKAGLFNFIIRNQDIGQIIIIENELPGIDYAKVNLIEFTHDHHGRYGFIIKE